MYFDTQCIQLLENNWLLSKKKLIISATNFYFQNDENRVLTPLYKANKRGASSCDWKKAYQALKHNRTINLEKGNIKNLLRALGALFILNIYFKDEVYNFEKNSKMIDFHINMGSDIFSIKLHEWFHYDSDYSYQKRDDFDECIYLTKCTDDSIEKKKKAHEEMNSKTFELFLKHPKLTKYLESNDIDSYKGNNFMWDILGQEDYIRLINIAGQDSLKIIGSSEYEAILNKNVL